MECRSPHGIFSQAAYALGNCHAVSKRNKVASEDIKSNHLSGGDFLPISKQAPLDTLILVECRCKFAVAE